MAAGGRDGRALVLHLKINPVYLHDVQCAVSVALQDGGVGTVLKRVRPSFNVRVWCALRV